MLGDCCTAPAQVGRWLEAPEGGVPNGPLVGAEWKEGHELAQAAWQLADGKLAARLVSSISGFVSRPE